MPLRSMCWRCEGVRATCTLSIAIGTGAAAILGPPAYSPARKQARPRMEETIWSQRWATFRAEARG
eukprot:5502624-Pleurochrysis_carterae.AAC.1